MNLPARLARRSGHPSRQHSGLDKIAPLAPNAWLRFDLVERMLPGGVTDVLEIGCGRGGFGARIAGHYNYVGIEPDEQSWAVAKARLDAVGHGDVRNVSSDAMSGQQFDLICAFEVLEHIEDDAGTLAKWCSLLRPGGWLLLSVPAHQHRFGPWDEMVGHFRRYDPDGMTQLLADSGFTDISVKLYGFPLGYLLEPVRDVIGKRRRAAAATASASYADRTSGSGRQFQPSSGVLGTAIRYGTIPFCVMQRAVPGLGTGLVVRARLTDPSQ